MANKKCWENALKDAGELTAEELWETVAVLGQDAGFKEVLASKDASERVKRVIKNLTMCMSQVVCALHNYVEESELR